MDKIMYRKSELREEKKINRIVWVDIYKALAIILVVIGHSTGMFNQYIYQFHVSAFFFISGYVVQLQRDNFLRVLVKKIYTLIFPLIICTLICGMVMEILCKHGSYQLIFGEYGYIGTGKMLWNLLTKGQIYAWVLGAAWFLVALFTVSIISKLVWNLACKNVGSFVAYTILLYLIGYRNVHNSMLNVYNLNLALIAQFFFGIGFVVKEKQGERLSELGICPCSIGFLISTIIIGRLGQMQGVTVDYAGAVFSNIGVNTFAASMGIIWLYCLAMLLAKINCKHIIRLFVTIGQNTMGIVLLHFVMFKVVAAFLCMVGVADLEEIARITPSLEIGIDFWWLYLLVSLGLSVLIWCFCKRNLVLSTLIGTNRNVIKKIEQILNIELRGDTRKKEANNSVSSGEKIISVGILIIGYLMLVVMFLYNQYQTSKAINIQFPTDISKEIVSFEEGWHLQGDEEPYRWIEDKGTIVVKHRNTSRLVVSGYIPEDFFEVTQLKIVVNEKVVGIFGVTAGQGFEYSVDLSEFVDLKEFNVTFDFNGVHLPEEGSQEIRLLSGSINKIYIE